MPRTEAKVAVKSERSEVQQRRGGYDLAQVVTGLKRGTLYALVSRRQIPHRRVTTRLVVFDRDELEAWMDESTERLGGAA